MCLCLQLQTTQPGTTHLKDHEDENLASHHLHLSSSPEKMVGIWHPKEKNKKKLPWPCFKLGYALESFMTVKLDGFKSLNGFGMVYCEAFRKITRQVARVSAFLHIQKLSVHTDRSVWSRLATLADSDNHIILHLFLHQSSINGLDVISEAEEEKKRITQQGMVLAGHSWSFGRGFLDKTIWSQWQFREFCGWWK